MPDPRHGPYGYRALVLDLDVVDDTELGALVRDSFVNGIRVIELVERRDVPRVEERAACICQPALNPEDTVIDPACPFHAEDAPDADA